MLKKIRRFLFKIFHNPKYLNCYTTNGAFDPDLFYTEIYGLVPSRFELDIDDSDNYLDVPKTDLDGIKKLFKKVRLVKYYSFSDVENPDNEDFDEDDQDLQFIEDGDGKVTLRNRSAGSIVISADDVCIVIRHNVIVVLYDFSKKTPEEVKQLAISIYSYVPERVKQNLSAKISLINVSQGDYYTQTNKIDRVNLDINKYYNDDFVPVFNDIKRFLDTKGSGLILLSGEVGSGKTSLIRYLCSNYPHEYIIVPNSIAARMGDPELISFMTDHEDSVFVLEDCEQLLEDRSNNMFNNAISTILNMADGLLSDIMNIKLICTFNADITSIDPALLRKGRCFARYEFGKLCEEKVDALNKELNLGIKDIKPMTLAEVFNHESTDYSEKKETKFGF